jgi:hypothetical protein
MYRIKYTFCICPYGQKKQLKQFITASSHVAGDDPALGCPVSRSGPI